MNAHSKSCHQILGPSFNKVMAIVTNINSALAFEDIFINIGRQTLLFEKNRRQTFSDDYLF